MRGLTTLPARLLARLEEGDGERLGAALRVDRLRALDRLRVVPVASNLIGSILAWAHLGGAGNLLLTAWLVAMIGMIALDIWLGPRLFGVRDDASDPRRDYRRAIAKSVAYGVLWGLLASLFYAAADQEGRHFIAIILTAYLCSAALVLSSVPAAVGAFATPIILQVLPILLRDLTDEHVFLLQLVAVYAVVIPLVLRQISRSLRERIEALDLVDDQKQLIGVLLEDFHASSSDWMWQTDAELRFQRVAERFRKEAETGPSPLMGQNMEQLVAAIFTTDGIADQEALRVLEAMRARVAFREAVMRVNLPEGEAWWSASGSPTWHRDGSFAGYRGICRDVTERSRAVRELQYLAHHDALTGGHNRASFNKQLEGVRDAVQREQRRFALVQFDLDDFKAVNDTAGHAVGDEVLATAYRRINALMPEGAFLARIGGDEFASILELQPASQPAELLQLVEAMVASVARPIQASDGLFRIGASAGVAILPDNGSDPRSVLQLADIALYNAKADDANRVHLASAADGAAYSYRKVLERDLRSAVDSGQLSLHFQPVIEAATGQTIVMEALLRWRHPRFGFVSPAEFIPIAEQTGSIQLIGRWALNEACREAASWPSSSRVAVNISPRQIDRDDLGSIVLDALQASGLPPRRLELEITESAFLGGVERVQKAVRRLQTYGVSVAMDDFGTGYSSLSSLQDVPFDKLKIDKSLVTRDRREGRAVSILKSIVAIGKALDLHLTAEGVETAEQAAFLKGLGCNSLQGYLFSRPLPANELPIYFAKEASRTLRTLQQDGDGPPAAGIQAA